MQPIEKIKLIISKIAAVNDDLEIEPGLPQEKVLEIFRSLNVLPPQDIVELYTLYNGIGCLDDYFHLEDLNRIKQEYLLWQSTYQDEDWWQDSYLPLFRLNKNMSLYLDCKTLSLVKIDRELINTVEIIAEYYEHYLDAILYLFEQDALHYDKDEHYFELDQLVWQETRQKYQIKNAW